ncbi:MAG: hypothetical protein WBV93_17290 [Anaerobacillus sp.]
MLKSKMFFIIAALVITLIGCSQVEEGTYIQGEITKVNKENGNMEIEFESLLSVSEADSSKEPTKFKKMPYSQTVRVANPAKYAEGETVELKVTENYDQNVWDLDKLNIEIETVK